MCFALLRGVGTVISTVVRVSEVGLADFSELFAVFLALDPAKDNDALDGCLDAIFKVRPAFTPHAPRRVHCKVLSVPLSCLAFADLRGEAPGHGAESGGDARHAQQHVAPTAAAAVERPKHRPSQARTGLPQPDDVQYAQGMPCTIPPSFACTSASGG